MKNIINILLFCIVVSKIFAQTDVAHTRISILTVGPGDDLYSLFGHTAIRITDSTGKTDIVYNWGGFTFDQPNFYLKFLRGNLLYYSSADYYADFMEEYVEEQRGVYEQVLNINDASKQKIIQAVNLNMQGNNRFYKYDFLLDNCSTRVKNIVFDNLPGAVINKTIIPEGTTSRDLIHFYVERGGEPWIELGMDILLGARVDKPVSNDEAMFLPEFFMKGLAYATKAGAPVVKRTGALLQGSSQQNLTGRFVPLIVITIICVLVFIISTLKAKWAETTTGFIDYFILYATGLIGVLILFMWFATDHTVCKNNFNIAWALPTNFIVAFCVIKKPAWLSSYFFITAIITALLLAAWFWLPQQMNIALLPVVILLMNRYLQLAHKYKRVV